MQLFITAITYNPTEKEIEEGKKPHIIGELGLTFAESADKAKVTRALRAKIDVDADNIEVHATPFG